jgi:hypothetical protein
MNTENIETVKAPIDLTSNLTNESVLIPRKVLDALIGNLMMVNFDYYRKSLSNKILDAKSMKDLKDIIFFEAEYWNTLDKYETILKEEIEIEVTADEATESVEYKAH